MSAIILAKYYLKTKRKLFFHRVINKICLFIRFSGIHVSKFRQILMIYDTKRIVEYKCIANYIFDVPTSVAIITMFLNIILSKFISLIYKIDLLVYF